LRIGIYTDGLEECVIDGEVSIANGGVGVYIYNLIKHIQLVDSVNEYVLIGRGRCALDIYRSGNGRIRTISFPSIRVISFVLRTLDLEVRRAANTQGLDLVHYPNQFGGAFLPRIVPRVVTLHDLTPLLFPRFHRARTVIGYRLLIGRALARADHVIVDSNATLADVIRHGFAGEGRVTAIPLGADTRFRPGIRTDEFSRRYDLPPRFILSVGVLEPRKNHALLYEAIRRMHEQGERIGLVVVGRDGWRWKDPLENPAFAHLRPWVRICRNASDADLPEFYNRAEALAYPSFYEGFGLPIVEAMACGTPTVVSQVSSLPEVGGNASLLADPHDASDFAAKLMQLIRDAKLRDRLVAAGLDQARKLSWRRTAERTIAIYEKVISESRAHSTPNRAG
jgi:glycosyltransferase involved in cell wall biosynthesis